MRIAVTGKTGQIVTSLLERGARDGHEIIALGRPDLDLTDTDSVLQAITAARPDAVVSAAAYTAVDKAETEPDLAFATNVAGACAVARAARTLEVPLVHLSTDYVFDGLLDRPYAESDPTAPVGVYGASKLLGEEAVMAVSSSSSAILRVAWVYSPFGGNFVKTMLRLAADRDEISVVADQVGNPTSAIDIADGILSVASNLASGQAPDQRGLFHMTGGGESNWAEFAEAVFAASAAHGGPSARVNRITSAEYPTVAARPANSRLACDKIAACHGVVLPAWNEALHEVIARLQSPR